MLGLVLVKKPPQLHLIQLPLDLHLDIAPVRRLHAKTCVLQHDLDLPVQFHQILLILIEHVLDLLLDLVLLHALVDGLLDELFLLLLFFLDLVLDEVEKVGPVGDEFLVGEFLLPGEVAFYGHQHALELCEGELVQVLFGLEHQVVEFGVVLVLALVHVEDLDEPVD